MSLDQIWIADMRPVHSWNQPLLSGGWRQSTTKTELWIGWREWQPSHRHNGSNPPTSNRRISLHSKVVY